MDQLMQSWGLTSIIPALKENAIDDLETLEGLVFDSPDFKEIVPVTGLRIKLHNKLKAHKQNKEIPLETPPNNPSIEWLIDNGGIVLAQHIPSGVIDSKENSIIENSESERTSSNSEPLKKKSKSCKLPDFDLDQILQDHPLGPSLTTYSQYTKTFDIRCQSYLVEIISTHLLAKYGTSLANEHFEQIAEMIAKKFPHETAKTYYLPPVSKKHSAKELSEPSKGKLIDKYRNKKTFIREADRLKNLPLLVSTPQESNSNEEELSVALNSKQWLVNNREPDQVLHHWDTSYVLRDRDTQNKEYRAVEHIYISWPILKDSIGFELIERDFSVKYPEASANFDIKWNESFQKLIHLLKSKLVAEDKMAINIMQGSEAHTLPEDYRTFVQLRTFINLLPPKALTVSFTIKEGPNKGKKVTWKPTIAESREAIIIHVSIAGDIEEAIQKRTDVMLSYKQPVQPLIIVVGPDETKLNAFYVRVDSVLYKVPSLLRAIEILFKIFIIYNVSYPVESVNFAYFVQWGMFGICTKDDDRIPNIFNILNKLKLSHRR